MLYLIGGVILQILGISIFGGAIGTLAKNTERKDEKTKKLGRKGILWGVVLAAISSALFVAYGMSLSQ